MMSKKQSRCHDNLVNSKSNTPTQRAERREPAALSPPVRSGGKHACSSASKASVSCVRSNSFSSRGLDSSVSGSRAGGSLKRSSVGQQNFINPPSSRAAPRPAKPPLPLCSSRSFSSLQTSSLTTATFSRSSRSLSRLDQKSSRDNSEHSDRSLQVKKGRATSGQLSRTNSDLCHGDDAEKMKTRSSSEPAESSSSLVSTSECHQHCNKVKKQSRDGVYSLCAMTSGMRRNLVHAVLKNVRPSPTLDATSSVSEQQPHSHQSDALQKSEHTNSVSPDCAEEIQTQHKDQELTLQSPADKSSDSSTISSCHIISPTSPFDSPITSSIGPSERVEEGEGASTQTGTTDSSSVVAVVESRTSSSTTMPSNDKCLDECLTTQSETDQMNSTTTSGEQQVSIHEQKTGQLIKEQINSDLQEELQQQRENPSPSQLGSLSNGSPGQALALQRLQKMNHNLHSELEALRRSQEEAREAELRSRVDLLAQQAQLLVTGDATALAQAHLEQDRRRFQEQRVEWERCVASLKSQLSAAEEQRKEAEEQRREVESRFTQLQQEVQGYHSLQEEAILLQKNLQEMKTQLQANEEAQAQKEARLQKHLLLLQASQDRERRSLAASLAQAEQHSQVLQERLDRAEEQLGSLNKSQTWTRGIERAQQQLQEELTCTVTAVQKLQEEREQLERRCEDLQSQLSEADVEVSRLQSRLKTDETHYYNMEHSYERVSEELQVALGRVKQKEADIQDIREGYERLLDRKEQELIEILLKMEVLGNSLEETEAKLNETMTECSCSTSQQKNESSETPQQTADPVRTKEADSGLVSNHTGAVEQSGSLTVDSSQQCDVTADDDPEKFMTVIQTLETKLFVTEEKLRDIMQRLEEHQGHTGCHDPHLCSQLTQSRATAQHLSLLLHSQAKQSQRFAQETENCCRMLVGRFQVALNIIQVCREWLQSAPINITEFEKQLSSAAACLQQGERDAEKQIHESRNAGRGEEKILKDEASAAAAERKHSEVDMESAGKCFMRELFVVKKMVSVLQSQSGRALLVPREDEGDVAARYRSLISQRIALKTERRTPSGRTECDNKEPVEGIIHSVCAEAELMYAALNLLREFESGTSERNKEREHERKSLVDITPPELAPYEGRCSEEVAGENDDKKEVMEREADWLERLLSRLQRRVKCLRQLCQETSDGDGADCSTDDCWENASASDLNQMLEQAKLIYLSERLRLDLEQQSEMLKDKLQALCREEEIKLKDEQEAFNYTLCQLQEDNSALREELERVELKILSEETGNQRLLENMQEIEDYHEERMNKLEEEFQEKIKKLQQIHEEEMKHLHAYYTKSSLFKEKQIQTSTKAPTVTECTSSSSDQTVMERRTKEELRNPTTGGDETAGREAYQEDHVILEAPSDESITALEETHRQLMGDLQQQHQQEVDALLKEKDQLLQEESAATMAGEQCQSSCKLSPLSAAIVAMRRAHKQELEKSRRSQHIRESADITQLQIEHEEELEVLQKELEALSVQHTQKCLENSQLTQELQDERKSSIQYQKENQELKKKQREPDEMTQRCFSMNGKQPHAIPQENDFYEMEVILRAREAEMQFLRQEACSLREELKIARMDKLYAQNKLKALHSNSQDEISHDVKKLCEDFKFSSLGRDASARHRENTVTNTNNSAFLKKTEKSFLTRQIRGMRSKSLKEGLSIQERMKLFESF
ncbi:trichohyalin isoform X2 [Labrus bergylta]|uniref:trichohyalin isoform X2 n=1 Tax=Labrus bergylta TaxID=56723 RepID=UPI003313F34F